MAIKSKAKKSEMCDWCIIDDENSGDTWNYQGSEKGAFEYLAELVIELDYNPQLSLYKKVAVGTLYSEVKITKEQGEPN